MRGQIWHIFVSGLGIRRKLITMCRYDCAIKYVTGTRALTGGILKILTLSEILPVYLVNRLLCLSDVVTGANAAYLAVENLLLCVWKNCSGIWQTALRNLEKFTAENCGPSDYSYLPVISRSCTPSHFLLPCYCLFECWCCIYLLSTCILPLPRLC